MPTTHPTPKSLRAATAIATMRILAASTNAAVGKQPLAPPVR